MRVFFYLCLIETSYLLSAFLLVSNKLQNPTSHLYSTHRPTFAKMSDTEKGKSSKWQRHLMVSRTGLRSGTEAEGHLPKTEEQKQDTQTEAAEGAEAPEDGAQGPISPSAVNSRGVETFYGILSTPPCLLNLTKRFYRMGYLPQSQASAAEMVVSDWSKCR